MQTLIIVSHPAIEESTTQRFLYESQPAEGVTWHHLERTYPTGEFELEMEHQLLAQHDRILFQFPFYWYSSPPLLKYWQDSVLTEDFAYHPRKGRLQGKEFGLVLSTGVQAKEYQAGGKERYTISELTRPFQAMAQKCGMEYLSPFVIHRFDYMNESQKKAMLIHYQQYLSLPQPSVLSQKEVWFREQLASVGKAGLDEADQQLVDTLAALMEENREQLDDLIFTLQEMKGYS